jgi:hypothetical protein
MATDLQAQIGRLIEAWNQPKRRDTMLPYLGLNTCGEVADLVSAQADSLDALSARIHALEGALGAIVALRDGYGGGTPKAQSEGRKSGYGVAAAIAERVLPRSALGRNAG